MLGSGLRPAAVERKPFGLLGLGSEYAWRRDCLTARIRGLRPAPRKGFPPLPRIAQNLRFCLCWVQLAPGGGRAQAVWLAWLGSECARRRDCLRQGFAGSALHPQGISSLDPNSAKLTFCLCWVQLAPGGGRAQAVRLAWLGSEYAWRRNCLDGKDSRAPPCTARDFLP